MADNEGEEPANRPACASCKHQRKRCHETCPMAPHFRANRTEEFQAVHKVFGISNASKMIKDLNFEDQKKAVKSIIWEAFIWKRDPINGPLGHYRSLEQQLRSVREELRINQQIIQTMQQQQQQQPPFGQLLPVEDTMNFGHGNGQWTLEPSSLSIVNNYPGYGLDGNITLTSPNYHTIGQGQDGGRGFQGVNPNFVQAQERENYGNHSLVQGGERSNNNQGRGSAAMYGSYGRGRGSYGGGYDAVDRSIGREEVRGINQGRGGTTQNNNYGNHFSKRRES